MGFVKARSIVKPFAIASVFASAVFGAGELRSSQTISSESNASVYVLTVSDAIAASELVQSVGGELQEAPAGFGLVVASLTDNQLDLVSRSANVSRISESTSSDTNTVGIVDESQALQVAGWPFRYNR
jgi:hypothetical protein